TAGVLWRQSASACVPAALVKPTLKAAVLITAGECASQVVAPSIAALVQEGMRAMATAKVKIAAPMLLAMTLLGGIGWAVGQRPVAKPDQASPEPRAKSEKTSGDLHDEPLPAEALVRLGTTRLRHGDNIESLQFTPDGKVLVGRGN